jgi:hypothetical protein
MLSLERSIQLAVNVHAGGGSINDLACGLPGLGREVACAIAVRWLDVRQQELLREVLVGEAELACHGCGLVLSGEGSVLRRGNRARLLRVSVGVLRFRLLQVTCSGCRRTWSPFGEILGLRPRQRVSEELERKLVEAVTNQSYEKTCRLAESWLGSAISPRTLHRCVQMRGSQVVFTPAAGCRVVLADGTKVPAARSRFGIDVRIAFQILGRTIRHGRSVVHKRIAGWSIGAGGWPLALPAGIASEVIVTDRESGIPEVIEGQHPGVRHQLCEWHLGHTANHLMALDHVPVRIRRERVGELGSILWGTEEHKRLRYTAFWGRITDSERTQAMLRDSLERILYPTPSVERTTSAAEREMREINRRTDVGALWSTRGVNHLLKLRHSQRLNPDDFERLWSRTRPASFTVVPQA